MSICIQVPFRLIGHSVLTPPLFHFEVVLFEALRSQSTLWGSGGRLSLSCRSSPLYTNTLFLVNKTNDEGSISLPPTHTTFSNNRMEHWATCCTLTACTTAIKPFSVNLHLMAGTFTFNGSAFEPSIATLSSHYVQCSCCANKLPQQKIY